MCMYHTLTDHTLAIRYNLNHFLLLLFHGVTLLAFGNGAPDIFSALAAINQPHAQRASLAFGALFGENTHTHTHMGNDDIYS